jgi:DNA-binding CsgD family transcriptional regulator
MLLSLTRLGWDSGTPAFRRVFTTLYMPEASAAEIAAYEEMQAVSASADTAARIRESSYHTDVSALASALTVPTLVMHVRGDTAAPFEEGRRLAGLIPGAQFAPLEGGNHILGAGDRAWPGFVDELRRFLATPTTPRRNELDRLTGRERTVLELVAHGLDNEQIARALVLSVRTVERHLSNIYTKLGVSGTTARVAAATRFLRHR